MIVEKLFQAVSKSRGKYDGIKRLFSLIRKAHPLFGEPFNPPCDNMDITLFDMIYGAHIRNGHAVSPCRELISACIDTHLSPYLNPFLNSQSLHWPLLNRLDERP